MKPVESVGIGLLYYNKGLQQFERALYDAMETLKGSGLVSGGEFIIQDGSPVDYAREHIVEKAIEHGHDAVIWVDTDLIIPPDALVRLVRMSNAGMPVAGGLYRRAMPKPQDQFLLTFRTHDDAKALNDLREGGAASVNWATLEELREYAEGGVTQVAMSAGGFSIVRREVYEVVEKNFGRPWYQTYDREVGDWCFEDTYFMRRLRRLGIPVFVDPELHAVHWSKFGPVPVTPDQPEMKDCVG